MFFLIAGRQRNAPEKAPVKERAIFVKRHIAPLKKSTLSIIQYIKKNNKKKGALFVNFIAFSQFRAGTRMGGFSRNA